MEAGAEGNAWVERQHDRVARVDVGPGRAHQERSDADRLERRLPGLEPVLVLDLLDQQVADRTEPERLQMAERVAHAAHTDARDVVVDEVGLHEVQRVSLERLLDGDAVVADPAEDLAHRFDRFSVRGYRDLEPADGLGLRWTR